MAGMAFRSDSDCSLLRPRYRIFRWPYSDRFVEGPRLRATASSCQGYITSLLRKSHHPPSTMAVEKIYHSPYPDVNLPETSCWHFVFDNPNLSADDKVVF